MRRTALLQKMRKLRFREAYDAGDRSDSQGTCVHRNRRDRSPWSGLMIHQGGGTRESVPGQRCDRIVTMDDATMNTTRCFSLPKKAR